MDNMFSIEALVTLSGASFLVYLIVSYTKRYIPFATDLYAVCISFPILLLAQFAAGASWNSWVVWFLAFANSWLVAATAGKANDKALDEAAKQILDNQ